MDNDARLALLKRGVAEITTQEELEKLLKKKEHPVVYLGTAVTGRPHIAYLTWVLKLADFLNAGFRVKLLLADLHGAIDNTPWELLEKRYEYYSQAIPALIKAIGADLSRFEIIKGSDVQKSGAYFHDVLRMATVTSSRDARKAGSEVVKQAEHPKVAGLIYPIMQALDEEYLGVDVQLGGLDQRKILMFAREHLPKIGYEPRVEVMTPMLPGLTGEKMSASDPKSKIDLLDSPKTIQKKLNKAECVAGDADNGIMAFYKHIIFTIKGDRGEPLVIRRPEKFGGDITYENYEALEEDFVGEKLHPADAKQGLAQAIDEILAPVREDLDAGLAREAYPEE